MSPAERIARALEDEGCRRVFGIPGTHTLELYDALGRSRSVTPVLVADERGGAFMADGISRSGAEIGVLLLVPGAGVTHALSGLAEALLDNVALVVLACGVRGDLDKGYQLHQLDQDSILKAACKAVLRPADPADCYAAVRRAFALAKSGCPGPVAVTIPAEYLLAGASAGGAPYVPESPPASVSAPKEVSAAAEVLNRAKRPFLYAGRGAAGARLLLLEAAEKLQAPVATTIQGKGVFPEDHPQWLWNGFGSAAPPFVRRIARRRDALLAIGCRFSEVATASYGARPPADLVHVDISKEVLARNYPARVKVAADAGEFLRALLPLLKARPPDKELWAETKRGHARTAALAMEDGRPEEGLRPAAFFRAWQEAAGPDAIYLADSGRGLFLAMEHLRLTQPGKFLAPVDFSCMGYSVPASIGAKLANPGVPVVSFTGDGALLMTGLELVTASALRAAPVICVIRDGELGQIAEFQRMAVGRKTLTALPAYDVPALARAVGARAMRVDSEDEMAAVFREALRAAEQGVPALLEAKLDLGRPSHFARGVLSANFSRLPLRGRLRAAARFLGRRMVSGL